MMYKLKLLQGIYITTACLPYRKINKYEELKLVLDPGCAITLIDTPTIDTLGYSAGKDMIGKSSLGGAVGISSGYMIKVPTFKCLGQEMNDFEIACHDLHSSLGVSGLLGMNFFKHFRMDIDFSSGFIHSIEKVA